MNPGTKRTLDIDSLLAGWGAPPRDDAEWERQAEAILESARGRTPDDAGGSSALARLFEAPDLGADEAGSLPGEPSFFRDGVGQSGATAAPPAVASGEKKMSQETEDKGSPKPEPGAAQPEGEAPPPSMPPERKRQSLKEIAARASLAAKAPVSTPVPGRVSSPSATPLPAPAAATPLPSRSAPMPSRPAPVAETSEDNSGIVDLGAALKPKEEPQAASDEGAKAAVAAEAPQDEQAAAAPESAAPSSKKSSRKPAAAGGGQAVAAKAAPRAEAPKKGSGGAVAGVVIAAVGLAAAFFMMQRGKIEAPPPAPAMTAQAKAKEAAAVPERKLPAPAATIASVAATPEPAETAAPGTGEPVKALAGGPSASAFAAAVAAREAAKDVAKAAKDKEPEKEAAAEPAKQAAAAAPAATGKPGDLASAMQQAVGGSQTAAPEAQGAEPAAGGSKSRSQNIPEQPSQGSVAAAVGAVMGAAKACVAGADDVSRAQLTFGSDGSVTSVSVTGWAAANGASGCVKGALKGAKVGPFAKPSYSFGVTIRP